MKLTTHSVNYDDLLPLISGHLESYGSEVNGTTKAIFVASYLWVSLTQRQQQAIINKLEKNLERKGL